MARSISNTWSLHAKLLRFAMATTLFLALLLLAYAAHVRWFPVDVVLYSAVLDGALVLLAAAAVTVLWRPLSGFNAFERVLMLLLWGLLSVLFAFAVPTLIDRSLSFYLLEKLQQHGGGLRQERFEGLFTHAYLREHHLIEVRLTEQLESGTVRIEGGCVVLTARGERLAGFSRWFRRNLLPRHRLLMGRYSDALVDPFRGGMSEPDDSCRRDTAPK
jgi:hypothetical protein